MKKTLIAILITLVIAAGSAFTVNAQAQTVSNDQPLVAIGFEDNGGKKILFAPYVKNKNAKSINAPAYTFVYIGDSVVLIRDKVGLGTGTMIPVNPKNPYSDLYAEGKNFLALEPTKIKFGAFRKPEPQEAEADDSEVTLNAVALDYATKRYGITFNIAPGTINRLADMGWLINEHALVLESENPAVFFDLKGNDEGAIAKSVSIADDAAGIIVTRTFEQKVEDKMVRVTDTWLFIPDKAPVRRSLTSTISK